MNVLVTGGGGFLGTEICKILKNKNYGVFSFSRNKYTHLEALGVKNIIGDLRDKESVYKALEGIDAIFHVAALAGIWGRYEKYFNINTLGTQNIVDAAIEKKIKYFIYTSTPSVVFDKESIENGNESLNYPEKFLTHYAYTKALAEKYVLSKSDNNFNVVALRPHLIWGPGDPHILPRLVDKARSGKLKQVGDGDNLVDVIYVENAALAHVQAFEKIIDNPQISGNAYFIGQERPVNLWQFINQLLSLSNVDMINDKISFKVAYRVGWVFEKAFQFLGINKPEPPMTRFVACQLAKNHYFSHDKARKDFDYKPLISIEEGLKKTFKLKHDLSQLVEKHSSIEDLNSGKIDL